MKSIQKITEGEVVAIDGKTLRGSYDKSSDQSAIQMVSQRVAGVPPVVATGEPEG